MGLDVVMADDDWMRPTTKPLPGPVASEAMQLQKGELNRIQNVAEHNGGLHEVPVFEPDCPMCRERHPDWDRPQR